MPKVRDKEVMDWGFFIFAFVAAVSFHVNLKYTGNSCVRAAVSWHMHTLCLARRQRESVQRESVALTKPNYQSSCSVNVISRCCSIIRAVQWDSWQRVSESHLHLGSWRRLRPDVSLFQTGTGLMAT